jgi:G protein-coupled receptor 107
VVVLVGTGWAYMKPLLAPREKKILMVVIPLQVLAEVAIVIMDENTPASRNWFTWRDVVHVVDIICCCAILLPIVWSIRHLREASEVLSLLHGFPPAVSVLCPL